MNGDDRTRIVRQLDDLLALARQEQPTLPEAFARSIRAARDAITRWPSSEETSRPGSRLDLTAARAGARLLGEPRPLRRSHRSRQYDLDQAVRAARAMLNSTPPQYPTTWRIAEAISEEEGSTLSESGLTSRWQRHKRYGEESITLREVIELAELP